MCAELLPEMVRLDDWGYPIVDAAAVPERLQGHARQALAACPTLALALRKTPGRRVRPAPSRQPS